MMSKLSATMALLSTLALIDAQKQATEALPEIWPKVERERPTVDGHSVCWQKKWRGKKLSKRQRKGR
jgi:hypothetical protein